MSNDCPTGNLAEPVWPAEREGGSLAWPEQSARDPVGTSPVRGRVSRPAFVRFLWRPMPPFDTLYHLMMPCDTLCSPAPTCALFAIGCHRSKRLARHLWFFRKCLYHKSLVCQGGPATGHLPFFAFMDKAAKP